MRQRKYLLEHQNDKPEAKLSGPVPAAGWIKELRAAEGGLWGRVEWTATASEMIARKEYRYLSPAILFHPKTRQIVQIKGAGLVHNPNLFLTALASQETTMLPPSPAPPKAVDPQAVNISAELLKLLNLSPDTPADQILAKLKELLDVTPDPAKFMPVSAVQEMLQDRRAELGLMRQERISSKVQSALNGHYITNGMRDWALELCETNEAAFDSFCEKAGPTFAYLFKESGTSKIPLTEARFDNSPLEQTICEQLGLKPGSLSI